MLTRYDFISIAFYFLFIAGVGIYFMWRSKNTSDYFRAGGLLPWWVTGASTWMASFSAWTFTGAAAKMYQTGPYVFGLYYAVLVPWAVLLFYTCYRFRRMQVITPLEAVRLRFGQTSQVFFTWSRLPFMLIFGGISLNATARTPRAALRRTSSAASCASHSGMMHSGIMRPSPSPHHSSTIQSLYARTHSSPSSLSLPSERC